MRKFLTLGGLVAAGFDASGAYLLTVTHSGRGVYSTLNWERVARDYAPAYPVAGVGLGIGPIRGQTIYVTELSSQPEPTRLTRADGRITLTCASDGILVEVADSEPNA